MEYNSKKYALSWYFDTCLFSTIKKYLHPQKGEKILEVGCNLGFLVKKMQEIGIDAYGVDINPEAIARGVTKNLFVADATNLPFAEASFDKLYSLHTIEHIPDIRRAFQEMERVVKPGGKVLLVYPAEPIWGIFALRSAIAVYKNPFLCRIIHIHKLFPRKIKELIRDLRLEYVQSHFPVLFLLQYLTILQKRTYDGPLANGAERSVAAARVLRGENSTTTI